jgi:hypothetical protein
MTRHTPMWLQEGEYAATLDRSVLGALWPTPAWTGCEITKLTAMDISIAPGKVAVPASNATGTVLCHSDAAEVITLTQAPPAGSDRVDAIICEAHGTDLDGGAVNDFIFRAVEGVPAAAPVAPDLPPNSVRLMDITVRGGQADLANAVLTGKRTAGLAAGGLEVPAGRCFATVQTISSGTNVQIKFGGKTFCVGGMEMDPAGNGLMVPVDGVYHVHTILCWQQNMSYVGPGMYNTNVRVSGQDRAWAGIHWQTTNFNRTPCSDLVTARKGQVLGASGQSPPTAAGTYPSSAATYLTGHWVAPHP